MGMNRFRQRINPQSAAFASAIVANAAARISAIASRVADGTAADQTEAEIARVSVYTKIKPGAVIRITSVVQCDGLALDVAKFFNLGIGPVGVSYAGATKIMKGSGFSQLVATAAGNTRVTCHQLTLLVDSETSQFFVNGTNPAAVIGPSNESGVLVPLSADLTKPFDVVIGGYFAASAPVGANIKVRRVLIEVL